MMTREPKPDPTLEDLRTYAQAVLDREEARLAVLDANAAVKEANERHAAMSQRVRSAAEPWPGWNQEAAATAALAQFVADRTSQTDEEAHAHSDAFLEGDPS